MPLTLEIVTAERQVLAEDDVDMVVAPAIDGEVGILPHHAPLITVLQIGELRLKKGSDEQSIIIAGGFLEVLNDKVTILADVAERVEEIDVAAAEQARSRAEETLRNREQLGDSAGAEAALRLATLRLRVGTRRKRMRREEG
ncbi:MAG TPA: F0F1 ATP synthase subunit epsilon [Chloroflexia bacterium]|nr:F0F1 ATP synthase subunit epsilon [Chloroflexia bacterium]